MQAPTGTSPRAAAASASCMAMAMPSGSLNDMVWAFATCVDAVPDITEAPMRIVAGKFRGREIHGPTSIATRPTSDRVRESLFNILAHGVDGFELEGARVMDLFAGTGALGLKHCRAEQNFASSLRKVQRRAASSARMPTVSAPSASAKSGAATPPTWGPARHSRLLIWSLPIRPITRGWVRRRCCHCCGRMAVARCSGGAGRGRDC